MYLLIGSEKALLIDTGDVEDPGKVGLARTVQQLLPGEGAQKLPLLVVHTHRHPDHRAGDRQLKLLPSTQVVGYDLDSVEKFYGLPDWPSGRAAINLGGRAVDVIPTPGHNETEVTFYDRGTGLVFCGDFLLPGRILVDDIEAYRASATRLIDRLGDWPVTAFLGGHIEMDAQGKLYKWGAQHHPDERPLPMTLADLKALSAALEQFNGFYTDSGGFTMTNPLHNLLAIAVPAGLAVLALLWLLARYLRRRSRGPAEKGA
jgi:glyoxylase-like metal-dependent hydrolase (beta-lactamase superfamily II)